MKSITGKTPTQDLSNHREASFASKLQLADPDFGLPGQVDLLLGQDVIPKIIRGGTIRSPGVDLYAMETVFGWVIGGFCSTPSQAATTHVCCHSQSGEADQLFKAFWEIEEPPTSEVHLTEDDQRAMDMFKNTVSRDADGRYVVNLPRAGPKMDLGHSRQQALRRFYSNRSNSRSLTDGRASPRQSWNTAN